MTKRSGSGRPRTPSFSRLGGRLLSVALALVLAFLFGQGRLPAPSVGAGEAPSGNADSAVAEAYAAKRSDVAISGAGEVVKVLPDDRRGSRHQRFVLALPSGATLLVAHNIDLAPRIERLKVGDRLRFAGEYEWNEQGGVLHWTHRDPRGKHAGGYLERDGRRYE